MPAPLFSTKVELGLNLSCKNDDIFYSNLNVKGAVDLTDFLECFRYLVIMGIAAFFAGRIMPKKWFRHDMFPYKSFEFEKDGRIYEKLNIRKWHKKVPDMSRILPGLIPAKNLSGDFGTRLQRMLQETCVAEMIHSLLFVAGFHCLKLYPGTGGAVVVFLYNTFLNLPFIIIQRYNRPRLARLEKRIQKRKGAQILCEC